MSQSRAGQYHRNDFNWDTYKIFIEQQLHMDRPLCVGQAEATATTKYYSDCFSLTSGSPSALGQRQNGDVSVIVEGTAALREKGENAKSFRHGESDGVFRYQKRQSALDCTYVEREDDVINGQGSWEDFHRRHGTGKFFKERRYLLLEFPELLGISTSSSSHLSADAHGEQMVGKHNAADGHLNMHGDQRCCLESLRCNNTITLLEVGCGSGSSVLPILGGNSCATVWACDLSPSAVLLTLQSAISTLGPSHVKSHLFPFVCNPCLQDFPMMHLPGLNISTSTTKLSAATSCTALSMSDDKDGDDVDNSHGKEGALVAGECSYSGSANRHMAGGGLTPSTHCGGEVRVELKRSGDDENGDGDGDGSRDGKASGLLHQTCPLGMCAYNMHGIGGGHSEEEEGQVCRPIPEGGVDCVTLIFTLSALAPPEMPAFLRRIQGVLREGGLVLFRDYGLYDMTMLRFPPAQRVADRLYRRKDGTLSYFFDCESVASLFEEAGFIVEENDYCCVKNVNQRKPDSIMYRVWIHGKFRKPVTVTEAT